MTTIFGDDMKKIIETLTIFAMFAACILTLLVVAICESTGSSAVSVLSLIHI